MKFLLVMAAVVIAGDWYLERQERGLADGQ
ncbi:hypothetical protein FDI14_gp137 [Mycobacterium phage SirDuracell]|uniref:Uncharacterized protein n=7 Tax=Kostyavirus TaxID=1623284 RepID=G1D5Y0_9CAUD|nr:hypothetical protein DRDREY_117 [Mycobacterium phage DrDrey]YP_009224380.1 hypothetical protein SEA_DUSK_114 [Mycobacterium phage Dusk]YP_009225401.1 hypothetical protein SEA_MINDY_116 [Mycobacterium phage Mindy]YP_009591275.1 hypothetical protein FDG56_gp139 [Mycobacterium phage Bask21]YP_009608045.1 hypothetical protein FDI14_gp137 [Mycobacterium phage SirDuracell]AEK08963.1 hypothetical protein PBI_HENRY_115 [Mycobacterium phage Henry]AGR48952.1 hypothetical protein PBI_ABCAT_114 [Mycob